MKIELELESGSRKSRQTGVTVPTNLDHSLADFRPHPYRW
jgi:hypothetical protein